MATGAPGHYGLAGPAHGREALRHGTRAWAQAAQAVTEAWATVGKTLRTVRPR